MNRISPTALAVTVLALVVTPNLAGRADDDGDKDHDRARRALEAGDILPLGAILAGVTRTVPGQILEVELERDDGRWLYELTLLAPGGRVVEVEVDARTGAVLEIDGHRDHGRDERHRR